MARTSILHHHAGSVTNEIIEAGMVAGLVGGVAMGLLATLYAGAAGLGFAEPAQAVAATVVGTGGLGGVVLGVVIHLVTSMMLGVVFATIVPREVRGVPAFAFGAFAGLAILVIMNLIVLPFVNPATRSHLVWGSAPNTLPVAVAFWAHMAYGAGLSLAPLLRRRFSPG
jgi:hypothetical protein